MGSRGFLQLVDGAGPQRAELETAFRAVHLPHELAAFFSAYAARVRILALADLESLDARVNVAQAERLFTLGGQLWMRVFTVHAHADVVQRFAATRELPLLVFFGQDGREFARWGPRPAALEKRLRAPGAASSDTAARAFYDQSRGVDLAGELRLLLAAHAAGAAPPPTDPAPHAPPYDSPR